MSFYVRFNRINNENKIFKSNIDKTLISTHINANVITRLANKNPADINVYSIQEPYGGSNGQGLFVRNTDCWINGITNISCFSPAQFSGWKSSERAGTLITTKHVLFAAHFIPDILPGGTPILFVDDQNNNVRRNIISYAIDNTTDIAIGLLDQDVSSNIKIAKVLPTNYTRYIETTLFKYAIALNRYEQALVKNTTLTWGGSLIWLGTATDVGFIPNHNIIINGLDTNDPYKDFTRTIEDGDSGNPIFIIIDNELVLLTTWDRSTYGPFITARYSVVNQLINNLSPLQGYSLTAINLAEIYKKYS